MDNKTLQERDPNDSLNRENTGEKGFVAIIQRNPVVFLLSCCSACFMSGLTALPIIQTILPQKTTSDPSKATPINSIKESPIQGILSTQNQSISSDQASNKSVQDSSVESKIQQEESDFDRMIRKSVFYQSRKITYIANRSFDGRINTKYNPNHPEKRKACKLILQVLERLEKFEGFPSEDCYQAGIYLSRFQQEIGIEENSRGIWGGYTELNVSYAYHELRGIVGN